MKRVLSACAVVAIVSSALAFAPTKGGSFCASLVQNAGCAVVNGKTELNNGKPGTVYYKDNAWNGNSANCSATQCSTQVTFYPEI